MDNVLRFLVGIPVICVLLTLLVTMRAQTSSKTPPMFARLQYTGTGGEGDSKGWYTDYPLMDEHVNAMLARITFISPAQPALVKARDKSLFEYAMIYTVEPEQMILSTMEAENLREYLARGGFWFMDDFHGVAELRQVEASLQQVLPGARFENVELDDDIFHIFFDIRSLVQVLNDGVALCAKFETCEPWENGPTGEWPLMLAVRDSNGRIIILAAYNNDLGDGLEWIDQASYPAAMSAFATKLWTNVIVYAVSH